MKSQLTKSTWLFVALLAAGHPAGAESTYDQPYLGWWPKVYVRFSAAELAKELDLAMANKVKQADLIVVASARHLKEIKVAVGGDQRTEFYEADVTVLRVIKGTLDEQTMHLKFRPSATSLEAGAQHVFLLQTKAGQNPAVIDAWYVYPEAVNRMRVVGAYNCSTNVGMAWLESLVSGKTNPQLAMMLQREYRSKSPGAMYSAVIMAAGSPISGHAVLAEAVAVKDRRRFDLRLYCVAAHALAKSKGDAGLQIILNNIPNFSAHDRISESVVFDLVATYGSPSIVPDLIALVQKRPALAVSAAFAMSKIDGPKCKATIQGFVKDEQLAGQIVKISDGYSISRKSARELFRQAIERCDEQ